jgi:hypothetical protein
MAANGAEEVFSSARSSVRNEWKAAVLRRVVGSTLLRRYTLGERKQANVDVV